MTPGPSPLLENGPESGYGLEMYISQTVHTCTSKLPLGRLYDIHNKNVHIQCMLHTYIYHYYEYSVIYISLMFTQRGYLQQMRFQRGFNFHFKLKFNVFFHVEDAGGTKLIQP